MSLNTLTVVFEDSNGDHVTMCIDESGDVSIGILNAEGEFPGRITARFCGPGGDGCYALEFKKELRDLVYKAKYRIEQGQLRGRVVE